MAEVGRDWWRSRQAADRWRRRVPRRGALAPQPRRPDQLDRLQGRTRLHVEPDPVSFFDCSHRSLARSPHQRGGQGEAGADGRHAREDEPEPAGDHREGAYRPEAGEGGSGRIADLRHRGGGPGLRQERAHRLGRLGRTAEDQPADERDDPPGEGDEERQGVTGGADHDRGHGGQHRRRGGGEQHGHSQQVDERHRAATLFGQRFEHAHESLWARNRQVGRLRDLRW